jgi:hypothetical protein
MNVELRTGLFLHSYVDRCPLRMPLCLCMCDACNDYASNAQYRACNNRAIQNNWKGSEGKWARPNGLEIFPEGVSEETTINFR